MNRNRLLSLLLALLLALGAYALAEEAPDVELELELVEALEPVEGYVDEVEMALEETELELGDEPIDFEEEALSLEPEMAEAEPFSGYVLMNIPFDTFMNAIGANAYDVDAVTAATNKVGNYGKAGGAFHSIATASIDAEGNVTAVGGENGAKLEGVIWPVMADTLEDIAALGGVEITDDSAVTIATVGRGSTSFTNLTGYQSLMEAPAYSYYILNDAPDSYLTLTNGRFVEGFTAANGKSAIDVSIAYGGHHADISVNTSAAVDIADKLVSAAVLTTDSGETLLVPMYQVWSASELGWNVDSLGSMTGRTVTNIRYYCMSQGGDYANYVYDYPVNVYVGELLTDVTAAFDGASAIRLTGVPADAQNVQAEVYYSAGRGSTPEYLTDGTVAVVDGRIALNSLPEDGKTYTVVLTADNYGFTSISADYTFSGYALVNIPFDTFMNAIGADADDIDAVTAATNKVGNYGKAGGAFHSIATASIDAEGNVTAVGGENGAKLEGVIWPVSAESMSDIVSKGGQWITDDSAVTVATVGKGSTSSTDLTGYQCLMEAPAWSYYILDSEPDNSLKLANGQLTTGRASVVREAAIDIPVSYGGHHADVSLNTSAAADVADKLVNAAVLTTDDGDTLLVPMYQVWAASEIGWDYATLNSLTGKTITQVTFYCTTKDVASYENYVYAYPVSVRVSPMLTAADVTASFEVPSVITLKGLPADARNVRAQVYYSAGRGATPEYLTDSPVAVSNGAIRVTKIPEVDKTYTIELTSDNYGFASISATYTATGIIRVSGRMTADVSVGTNYQIELVGYTLKSLRASGRAAEVSETGFVVPVKAGTSRVTLRTTEGRNIVLTLKVTDPSIPTGISIAEGKTIAAYVGTPIRLTAEVLPATADKAVTWKSSAAAKAYVDDDGWVTPLKAGTVRITATTVNRKRASIVLKITDPTIPTAIAITQGKTATAYVGTPFQLNAALQPATANKSVTWRSGSPRIATVDDDGLVTPLKAGKVTISAVASNRKRATIRLTVIDPSVPTGVVITNGSKLTLKVGESVQLDAIVKPATADQEVTYRASGRAIDVTDDGEVTALRKGSASVTVKAVNGKRATIRITVK